MQNKVLTISIAAYNAEKYLGKALESLIRSKYFEQLQAIVVNDGSKDTTLTIAQAFAQKHPNSIQVIDQLNGGYGSTINASVEKARGKYFKLLDADDFADTDALDALIERLALCSADVVLSDYNICYENGDGSFDTVRQHPMDEEGGTERNIEALTNCNLNPSFYIRSDILQSNHVMITEHCFYTDLEFCTKGIVLSKSFVYYPLPVYQYRVGHEGQSMSAAGRIRHLDEHEYVVKETAQMIFSQRRFHNMYEKINRMLAGHIVSYYYCLDFHGRYLISFSNYIRWLKDEKIDILPYLTPKDRIIFQFPPLFSLICAKNSAYQLKIKIKKVTCRNV